MIAWRIVRAFHLKITNREEGPYAETQIAQMFADGRIDRNTPCKSADRGDWRSIDDLSADAEIRHAIAAARSDP